MDGHLALNMGDLVLMWWHWATAPGRLVVTIIATLAGAWAGGAAAFNSERSKRELDEKRKQGEHLLRAALDIYRLWRIVWSVRHEFVKPLKQDSRFALILPSPINDNWPDVRFDFSSLSFLLAEGKATAMTQLSEAEAQLEGLRARAKKRELMYAQIVQPTLAKLPISVISGLGENNAEAETERKYRAVMAEVEHRTIADLNFVASELAV